MSTEGLHACSLFIIMEEQFKVTFVTLTCWTCLALRLMSGNL